MNRYEKKTLSRVLMKEKKNREYLRNSGANSAVVLKHIPAKGYSKALMLYQKGQLRESLAELDKLPAASGNNNDGTVDHLRAGILFKLDKMKEAVAPAMRAVASVPSNAEYLNTLGVIMNRVDRPLEALGYLSKASTLDPGRAQTYKNMAAVLWKMERHEQSLVCYRKALELDENNLELLKIIAYNYYLLGDLKEAADYYERALARKGDHSEVWCGIGSLLQSKGDSKAALKCYEKALEINPRCFSAYQLVAHTGQVPDNKKRMLASTLKEFLHTDDLSAKNQRNIYFSLARLFHDLKEYDTAFHYYVSANEYRHKDINTDFSLESYEEQTQTFISTCNKPLFQKFLQYGSPSRQPVFVVGMPRSGTTLLEQVIASHSKGFGAGELPIIKRIAMEWKRMMPQEDFSLGLNSLISQEEILSKTEQYLARLRRHAPGAERIVDKMPHNLQFLWCIALLFPKAPVIHCRRDPRDNCFSCFVTDFDTGHGYKDDLYTLGKYYRIYENLMEHWKQVVPNPILTVQYEEMVTDPEKMTRKVIDHIGLDWEPECLQLRSKQHFSLTASNVQIRKGIYRSSVQRWMRYEKHLAPLLAGLEEYKTDAPLQAAGN